MIFVALEPARINKVIEQYNIVDNKKYVFLSSFAYK